MEQWVADAKTFKPTRWLKDASNEKLHPFASLPYGYGARMCLGRRFADLEMQVLLAKVCAVNVLPTWPKVYTWRAVLSYVLCFSADPLVQTGVSSRTIELQSYIYVRSGW